VSTPAAPTAYRVLLRLAPKRLRARHGAEMQALFLDMLDDARRRGGAAVVFLWLAAARDLVVARVTEPWRRGWRQPVTTEREPAMFGSDLRYTFRWLARQRSSTALVVAMLALGIAANVVVFSLVNGMFLRPFPFDEPERLVYVNETAPKWNLDVVGINYPDFHQWRPNLKLFDGLAIWDEVAFNLSEGGSVERIDGARVTYDFADVLRLKPLLGRMFSADEDKPGGPPVVVIGEGMWNDRFHRSEDVLGRTLKLNGVAHTIVGVMPAAAAWPANLRLWAPLAGDPAQPWQSYGYAGAIGRLKPGVSIEDAEKDLLRAHQPIWDARDKSHVVSPYAHSLRRDFSRGFREGAKTLFAAVAILLTVACANVASVMLARALLRRREMGIRLAIGASRTRLARQLFAENLVLAFIGGIAGLGLGYWALQLLIKAAGDQVPLWATFDLDWRVVAFTIALTFVVTLLFGLAPAAHAMRGNLRAAMHDASAGTTVSPGGRRTLSVLVASEFALAAVLLVCGGLLMRAYGRVQHVDPGFRSQGVLTFALALPEVSYGDEKGKPDGERSNAFWVRLLQRLENVPGVDRAGLVSCPPLGCHWGTFFDIEGRVASPGQATPVTLYRPATPGYFEAMGIRLKSGRFFNDQDGRGDRQSIIVNETFVKTFWPGVTDPVGRRIRRSAKAPWMTVVGFVADVKHYGLEKEMRPGVYVPLWQTPSTSMTVALHTTGDPAGLTASARAAVRELDPDLAMYRVRTMEQAIAESLKQRRLYSWLIGVFAATTLVLALGGAYGVTSYLTSQRTREIGIRVALGARTPDITRAVLKSSLALTAVGIAIGTAGAVAVARLLADLLFGVPPHDGFVLAATAAALITFAAAANWVPARRASRVDPMTTLRAE
jgi:putative ABC transport system permease protein